MSLGCSYTEFWDYPADAAAAYIEAEEYRKERRNYEMWLQGLYVNNAVGSALAMAFWNKKGRKPQGYLEYPIPITKREKDAEQQRKIEATIKFFMDGQKE